METPDEWYDPEGYRRDWYGPQEPYPASQAAHPPRAADPQRAAQPPRVPQAVPVPQAPVRQAAPAPQAQVPQTALTSQLPQAGPPTGDVEHGFAPYGERAPVAPAIPDETVVLPAVGSRDASGGGDVGDGDDYDALDSPGDRDDFGDLGSAPSAGPEAEREGDQARAVPTGGRAERRRAAKGRGRRRPEPGRAEVSAGPPAAPMSRLEARRAARAAKDSPAVVASRVVGEVFITFGVLMLLFVTYQLWWTNVRADQIAGRETHRIQDRWASGARTPGAFEPGQGFAIMHIPKLDVVAPIAEGINKEKVLDRGMVGHYSEGTLKTAMPSAKQGNFAVAGHRNTHGEPFRYINKLKPGDPIVVETQDAYYTYEMTSILPQTAPSNVAVIDDVPQGSGFTGPGRYVTLTTCTPEFTSTYRMIVWGKMVDERPRSEGKPDALVG
ncbi:class E sortase [Streptomyces sp. NBC_01754]|uniref:class E sortase n=1 Tax=Streptomyces sp. NBC_01754 TaxID=2975930 RepID=UPI003FA38D62